MLTRDSPKLRIDKWHQAAQSSFFALAPGREQNSDVLHGRDSSKKYFEQMTLFGDRCRYQGKQVVRMTARSAHRGGQKKEI